MSVCPECGSEVSAGMKFCSECGTRLDPGGTTVSYSPSFAADDDDGNEGASSGAPVSAKGAALIELDQVEGTAGRRMHDVGVDAVTIGRVPQCDIFLDDVTVSRRHAEVLRGDRGFRIRDVGSLNGTYVNRVRVDSVDLRNGDEIQVGKYRFKFVFT